MVEILPSSLPLSLSLSRLLSPTYSQRLQTPIITIADGAAKHFSFLTTVTMG